MKNIKPPKPVSVLLTSAGGIGATSYIDCLKNNYENRNIRVVCSDVVDQPIMHYKADCFHLLPKGNSKKYIPALIKLCKKENIDVVIPCSGSEVFTISKNLYLLNSKKIYTNVSQFRITNLMKEKNTVFELLKEKKIPVPKFFLVHNKKEFITALKLLNYPKYPVCFKPSKFTSSGGGRGFRILRAQNSLNDIILNHKPGIPEIDFKTSLRLFKRTNLPLLVMEYLPGKEISIHVLSTNGKVLYYSSFHKKRIIQSHSLESEILENKNLRDIATKIVEVFNYSYNMNIQLKLSRSGDPKVIEINPRFGGGISLPTAAGINFPYITLKMILNEILPPNMVSKKTKLLRYWKELFVQKNRHFSLT